MTSIQTENSYTKGQLVRSTATFTDSDSAAVDPAAVIVQYEDPSGNVTSKTYGDDSEVVKSSTGVYYIDIDADEAGRWYVYWNSTGTGQAANEDYFLIRTLQTG